MGIWKTACDCYWNDYFMITILLYDSFVLKVFNYISLQVLIDFCDKRYQLFLTDIPLPHFSSKNLVYTSV